MSRPEGGKHFQLKVALTGSELSSVLRGARFRPGTPAVSAPVSLSTLSALTGSLGSSSLNDRFPHPDGESPPLPSRPLPAPRAQVGEVVSVRSVSAPDAAAQIGASTLSGVQPLAALLAEPAAAGEPSNEDQIEGKTRGPKQSNLIASFSTSLDTVTLSGLLHERFPIHFTLKPRTRTYENFIRFLVSELRALTGERTVPATGAESDQDAAQRTLQSLTRYLEHKLSNMERDTRRNANDISDIVEIFSDDFEPSQSAASPSAHPGKASRSARAVSEPTLPNGHRIVVKGAVSESERSFRWVDRAEHPRLISGFLSLEIEELPEAERSEGQGGARERLLENLRVLSGPSIEVKGDAALLQLKVSAPQEILGRLNLVAHWGSYSRGSGPWVDEEISTLERQVNDAGEIVLRKWLHPERTGFYGVTIYAELGGEEGRVWLSELDRSRFGAAGFTNGDLTFAIEREEGDTQLHSRREMLVEQKELEALILRSLGSFELFVRAVHQLSRDHTIRGLGYYLYSATHRDSGLRRLLGEYYQRAVIELGTEPAKNRAERLRFVLALLQNLGVGEVVFVAPEGPHAIAGGLAQVVVGLPSALARIGLATTVITPLYEEAQGNKHRSAEEILKSGVHIGGERVPLIYIGEVKIPIGPTYSSGTQEIRSRPRIAVAQVYEARHERERVIFLRHSRFADRLYAPVGDDEQLRRAVFLSRGALELMRNPKFGIAPHIIVTNDWVSALIPPLLKSDPRYARDPRFRKVETLHILHNCGRDYQGRFYVNRFGEDLWPILGLSGDHFFGMTDPHARDMLNLTAGAIFHSQKGVLAVSRPYAQQLVTADGGEGLDELFRLKREILFGISNGVDLQALRRTFFDLGERARGELDGPARRRTTRKQDLVKRLREQKQVTKKLVQRKHGLLERSDALLVSLVGRLAEQKGIQLLSGKVGGVSLLERCLGRHPQLQFLIGGPASWGDPAVQELHDVVRDLESRYPGRIASVFSFIPHQEALEITLGSDLFLMPSRFEPGGITQLEALSCGTPVLARKVGGIAATLIDYAMEMDRGNSFLFYEFTSAALDGVMEHAISVMEDPERRSALIAQAVRAENDWSHRVPKYVTVLQQVAGVLDPRRAYTYLAGRSHLLNTVRVD